MQAYIDINIDMNKNALIIGTQNYSHFKSLWFPHNDSNKINSFLENVGFQTQLILDPTYEVLDDEMRLFCDRIEDKQSVNLFFFAGHGLQFDKDNFLIPVDANIQSSQDIPYHSYNLDALIKKTNLTPNALNIIILDACRNNPFSESHRGQENGLAALYPQKGSIIVYATSPNMTSIEKECDDNSIFTKFLLKNLEKPKSTLRDIFYKTKQEVALDTNSKQVPWIHSSLHGEDFFYFIE